MNRRELRHSLTRSLDAARITQLDLHRNFVIADRADFDAHRRR
jgi:hypothetical protein